MCVLAIGSAVPLGRWENGLLSCPSPPPGYLLCVQGVLCQALRLYTCELINPQVPMKQGLASVPLYTCGNRGSERLYNLALVTQLAVAGFESRDLLPTPLQT